MKARGLALVLAVLGTTPRAAAQQPAPAAAAQLALNDDEAPARLRAANALAPSIATLRGWARTLDAGEPRARRAAIAQLRALGHESLPVVRVRLRELAEARGNEKALARALIRLQRRRAAGHGTGADLLADALEDDATEAMRTAVELTSLSDALIAQHTLPAADALAGALLRVAPGALRHEAIRARKPLGALLVPTYTVLAADAREPRLRQLARGELAALGMPNVHRAFERVPVSVLPALLRVHGGLRSPDALPHVIAHVGDPRDDVHQAATLAAERFGARALPLLRIRHRNLLGAPPLGPLDAAAFLRVFTNHRLARAESAARDALDVSARALARGKLVEATGSLDRAPRQPRESDLAAQLARAYLTLGERHLAARSRIAALHAFRRALRHAPPAELARTAHARVLHLEAELRLAAGVADPHALTQAAQQDPTLTRATSLLDEVRGARVAAARERRRNAGLLAATLFTLAALLLVRDARQRRRLHAQYSQAALG